MQLSLILVHSGHTHLPQQANRAPSQTIVSIMMLLIHVVGTTLFCFCDFWVLFKKHMALVIAVRTLRMMLFKLCFSNLSSPLTVALSHSQPCQGLLLLLVKWLFLLFGDLAGQYAPAVCTLYPSCCQQQIFFVTLSGGSLWWPFKKLHVASSGRMHAGAIIPARFVSRLC